MSDFAYPLHEECGVFGIYDRAGTFASEFLTEMSPNGGRKVHFLAKRRMEAELPIEKVGAELRSMMSWLKK